MHTPNFFGQTAEETICPKMLQLMQLDAPSRWIGFPRGQDDAKNIT